MSIYLRRRSDDVSVAMDAVRRRMSGSMIKARLDAEAKDGDGQSVERDAAPEDEDRERKRRVDCVEDVECVECAHLLPAAVGKSADNWV